MSMERKGGRLSSKRLAVRGGWRLVVGVVGGWWLVVGGWRGWWFEAVIILTAGRALSYREMS